MNGLEQLVKTTFSSSVDVYDYGTVALYTPPPREYNFSMMNTSGHIGGRQSSLGEFGIESYNEKMAKVFKEQEYERQQKEERDRQIDLNVNKFAKNCGHYGFGTIESVDVNRTHQETIKIYTDLERNKIRVGYEPHHTKHTDKNYIDFGGAY